jgi:hypothetical protein
MNPVPNPLTLFTSFFSESSVGSLISKGLWILLPYVLPVILAVVLYKLWINYVRLAYIKKQGSVLLEIKLPLEITKSPKAMEVFFTSLYQTGSVTVLESFWDGVVRPWFSLELVSLGGVVKYYIWTRPKFKSLIETQLYAQYPGIEVYEVPDYTNNVYHGTHITMWGTYFKLSKPDAFPIRTYVDYKLDSDLTKEEQKIDPIVPVLEYLGSMRKGEQVWIQILIQAHRKEGFSDLRMKKRPDWKSAAQAQIKKIKDEAVVEIDGKKSSLLTEGQKEAISAIDRSLDKFPFEVGFRGIYIAENEVFNPIGITGLIGSVRQYSSNGELNGFKLGWFTDFDYPWQDFKRIRRNSIERQMLKAYKLRSFFQPPFKFFKQKPFILTTEELATIYHFPGRVALTPTFERIVSRKAEAPANLPI